MTAPTYPLTMPTSPNFTNTEWRLNRKIAVTESQFTGAQQVFEHNYALWSAVLSLPPMLREQAREWEAFFMSLHGSKGTFLIGDPDATSPQGAATGTITLNSAVAVGDFTVALATSLNSTNNVFRTGDYIQLGSASTAKLYMVTADANSNSSGVVTVTIEPSIKAVVGTGQQITYNSPKGLFRMESNDLGWSTNNVSVYGISFSCIEAL
jgi:hypothetical protein|tara:strand:+ start:2351 stop:2977 length:627 start_codon:yes stop_codon:yes gene_type:complete